MLSVFMSARRRFDGLFAILPSSVGYLSGCDEVGAFGVIDLDVKSAAHHLSARLCDHDTATAT